LKASNAARFWSVGETVPGTACIELRLIAIAMQLALAAAIHSSCVLGAGAGHPAAIGL
jgi:hypothetical protein